MDQIVTYIETLLNQKKPISKKINISELRYLESGHVDSLGLMKFIMELEDKFGVEISEDDMQLEAFLTVGGLANIIRKKLV